jgi:hypothetical protein
MRGKKKPRAIKGRGHHPSEQPDAVPSFIDPEWDELDQAENNVREQYRGMMGDDDN